MRKLTIVVVLALAALMGAFAAPQAKADVNVVGLRPFSPEANYMSLAGFYRFRTLVDTGVWISRDQAVERVNEQLQGGNGAAATH